MINRTYNQHFATGKYYESIDGVARPCLLYDKADSNVAIGTYTWIAAVSGKVARVILGNYSAYSTGAGLIVFASNSITKWTDNLAPNTIPSKTLEEADAGWFDSEVGFSITAAGSVAFNLSTRYYYYTPAP